MDRKIEFWILMYFYWYFKEKFILLISIVKKCWRSWWKKKTPPWLPASVHRHWRGSQRECRLLRPLWRLLCNWWTPGDSRSPQVGGGWEMSYCGGAAPGGGEELEVPGRQRTTWWHNMKNNSSVHGLEVPTEPSPPPPSVDMPDYEHGSTELSVLYKNISNKLSNKPSNQPTQNYDQTPREPGPCNRLPLIIMSVFCIILLFQKGGLDVFPQALHRHRRSWNLLLWSPRASLASSTGHLKEFWKVQNKVRKL